MQDASLKALWKDAARMDSTLRVNKNHYAGLKRKFVAPKVYSRERMFLDMAQRRVSIFRQVPVLVRKYQGVDTRDVLVNALCKKFPPKETSRVQVGPSHTVKRLPVREIMRRWLGGRAIVGVTDLHIRDTKVNEVIDTQALSHFNILIRGSEDLSLQEMMTLVIASRGNVTDSHSDDPDGSNHCFFGKKLWLAWDTFEGMQAGLEDVERQQVYDVCKFNMSAFLKLKSSRWFLVCDGETLFLPGNLTHKVITLEPYLGVGSFHVGLPSSLDSLTRWLYHGPLWSIADRNNECANLVNEAATVTLAVAQRARAGSDRLKNRWGYHYLNKAYVTWCKTVSKSVRHQVSGHDTFRRLLKLAASA